MGLDAGEEVAHDLVYRVLRVAADRLAEALAAELHPLGVKRVLDPVRSKDDQVAGLKLDHRLVVAAVVEEADGDSGGLGLQQLFTAADDGGR